MSTKFRYILAALCVLLQLTACAYPGDLGQGETNSTSIPEQPQQTEDGSKSDPEGPQQTEEPPTSTPEQPPRTETTTKTIEVDLNGDGQMDLAEFIYSTPDQLYRGEDHSVLDQEILFRTTVSGKTTQLRVDDGFGSIVEAELYSLEISPTRTAVIVALSNCLFSLHAFVWEEESPRELPFPECGRNDTYVYFGHEWEFVCLDGYRVQATCPDTGYTQLVQCPQKTFEVELDFSYYNPEGDPDNLGVPVYDSEGVLLHRPGFDVEAPGSFRQVEVVTSDEGSALCVRQLIRGGFLGTIYLGEVETYLTWDENLDLVLVRQNVVAYE